MDLMDLLSALIGLGFIALVVYLFVSRKLYRWHTLSEYERGIIYRHGKAFQDAGPGTYKLRKGRDFLAVVDIRPVAFNLDQAAVSTLDGRTALYGVAGKIQIQDVRKAVYCARNSHDAALAKTVATVRRMLNDYGSEDIRCHTQTVCDNITHVVCDSMGEFGIAVSDFRVNQLRILEAVPRTIRNSSAAPV